MPLDNKTQQIYTTLKGGGADVGSEQEFNDYFYAKGEQGYQNRLEVWKTLKGGGADVGNNYEEFAGWLQLKPRGTQKPAANQTAPQQSQPKQSLTYQAAATQQPKPTQTPQPIDYLHRPGVEVNGKDYWSSELQKQKDEPKPQIDPMADYKQEIARQQQPVTQTNTPADQYVVKNQGQFENDVRQSAAKNAKDLFGIGVDYEVGRVVNEATKRWEKQFDPRGMVGEGSEMFALTRANKEIDPERMTRDLSAELQKRIGGWLQNEDKVEAIVSEAQKLGVSPDDYANMVVDNIFSQAQKRLEEKVLEGYMPKGTADYILSGLHDSLIGTLFDMGTMTKGQRQMMQRANQQFSEENKKDNYWGGTVTDLVRGGVGFMGDAPVFGALGKVASPMVRGTGALLENMGIRTTMGMSDAAFQRLSQVALNNSSWLQRMGFGAGRAIAGSAYNFGLYEGTSNVVNDLSVGDDTSLGTLAGDFIEGFAKGSAKGAVLGAFSRPFQAVSPRFGVRSDMGIGQKVLVGTGKGALATGNIMAEGLGFTAGSYLVDENARNRVKNSEHPWKVVMQDTMENTMMAGIFKMMNGHNILHPVESLKKAFEPSADSSFNFQNWQKKEIEEAYGGKFISTMEDIARSADSERNTKMSQFYEDFMNRNDISWDTKNKVSAILTGNMAMFPPIPSRISIDNDKKEVVAMGRNGEVLFRREYENPEEAEAIKSQLDMSRDEQMLHNLMGTFLVKDKDGNVNPESQKQLDDTMAQVGYETALNKEGIVNALNKAPDKRSEMEQYAIDELYDRLYNIRFPENQPHPAQDRQNGRDIADKTLDISELDPTKNPNGIEPGKYDQLTQAYDEANKALEAAFKNNDAFYQFVKEQRNNGLSDGEIALEARKMAFSEEESQALIDYERAREQVNGFVELTGERIGEYVSNEVSNMTFKGELDGQPVNDRFVRVVDDDGNQYFLRTGKVTVGEDGRLISTDGSGTVIVRGEDGKDKMVLADTVKMMPEDPANPMRDDIAAYSAMRTEQLEEAISLAIDADGKLQQTEEPKSQGQLAYEQEQDDVQQNGGLVKNDLADQTLSETLRGSLHSLGRKIGKKIQVVTKDELKQINPSAPDNARGMRSADNKTLYLVSDYVKDSEYMQRFVAGHELTHSVKSESGDEKVWNEFVDSVRSHMGDAAFEQAVKNVEELYEKSGVHLDREAAIEEVCSDWAGEHLMQDEASIRHIVESVERAGRDSVSFTQRIKQLFEDMIAAITGSGRTLSSEDKAQLEKLIRARDLWEQMYNECVAKNEAKDKAVEEQRIAEQKAADERKAREDKGVVFGEDGEADYTKMTPEATITDLTEQAGPELVETVVNTMLNNAEKALKGVKDVKPASDKPSDVIAAAKETAANKKAAQDAVEYWKEVQEKHKEMVASAEAEAKRQEEEEAKRQAEEAARLQAEAERQERLSTPEGRAAEIAKAKVVDRPKVAQEIYGEAFNGDMTPSGVDEYIMSYFSGKIPELGKGFIDTDSFEKETGHEVKGFKGDSKAYYPYLAGRGKGKTLKQVAEEIWHSMPEALKETITDADIMNKVNELLTGAQKTTDIRDALLNSRIREAERTLSGESTNAEEHEAEADIEETAGGGMTNEMPFAPFEGEAPFSLEKAAEQNGASYSLVDDAAGKKDRRHKKQYPIVEGEGFTKNEFDRFRKDSIGKHIEGVEATKLLHTLKNNAEDMPEEIEFTEENYNKLFGNGIDTPIGHVKMSDGQKTKMEDKSRGSQMALAKRTLEDPDYIVSKPSRAKEGQETERPSSYLFIKTFKDAEGKLATYFFSVSMQKEGMEVVMSNYIQGENQVKRDLKEGTLAYIKDVTLPSESSTSAQGDQYTTPAGDLFSEGKDSKNSDTIQENQQKVAKINTSDPMEAISQAAEDFRKKQETDGENRVMTEEQRKEERKKAQFDIIQKTNPKDKDLNHTWIEKPEDVKTFQESFKDSGYDINEDLTPDFTSDMAKKAIETGKIKVYSSHRIKDGEFVTPSQMEAKNYAGEGKVYSKNVPLEDVAWIDPTQGQYAKVDESKFSLIGSQGAESMDKAEGTTRRIDNRKTAEEMEKAGKDTKTIWYATGWERGKDGKWRYEIPDFNDFAPYGNMEYRKNHPVTMEERERFVELNTKKIDGEEGYGEPITEEELQEWAGLKAKINPTGFTKDASELKLSDFIDAEDLFSAYPELRDMKVEIEDLDGEFSGMYTPDKTILLDGGLMEKAKGNDFDEALSASSELKDTLIHEIQHAIQDIEGFSHGDNPHRLKGGSEIGDDAYNRSAGEVEARNVEKRRLMGAGTRRKKSPESTEDVSREEQHVYEGNLSEDMRAGRPIDDPMEAIERSSKLWKEERRVLGTQPKAHAETSNGGRMAIDAGKEPTIEDEYAHYSLSPSPTNTLLQTDENRRYHELIGGKAFDWIEAHQNDLQSVIALEKGILKDAAPKDYENVFYAMNHMGGVVMQKENNYVRHYYSRINNAANEAAAKLRGNDKKKKYQEAMDEVEDYVAMKCGLERNRALYVRDNGNDQDKADFANLMDSLYNDLSARRITFADYLGKMDEFIRSRIDSGYKADKHDMSGLSNKNANGYDDAALTQEVMDTEALFGEALTDEVWNSINSATDYILNERYESGLMSKAEKERLERQWHFYVPLQGWAEPTAEEVYDYTDHMMTSVGSPVLKRAGGRTSKADDPLAMIGANASRLIRDAELNRVHQTAVRLARGHAGNGLLEEMNTWYEKTGTDAQGNPIWEEAFPQWSPNATADDITQAIQQFNADMEAKQQSGDARKTKRGLNIRYPMAVPSHVRQHIINAWIGGEKVRLIVQGNPRAAQALNGELRKGTDNKFVQAWDYVNRLMMGLNTSYNPEFIVSNGERDLEMAVNNLIVKEGREYSGRFLKNYFGIGGGNTSGNTGLLKGETLGMKNIGKRIEAFNGIWNRYYNNALDMSKESDRMFKEFMDNGGPTGYVTNQNLDKYKKELYKGVREKDGNVAAKAMTKLLENPFEWALSSIEELNTRVENLTRFAAYQTSRQGGRSVLQSIHDAKEVSVNFGTRGAGGNTKGWAGGTAAWGRHTFYFYNAGVQSLEMYARNIRKHPIKGVSTMMLKPFMAGAAVALWNMLNGSDDETGMKSYAQLNPWVRRNNLIIPAGDGAFWTYPLPIEIRAFYGMGEAAAGMFFEETRDPNPALTMAGQITQMLPIDVLSYMSEQPKDITDLALRFGTAVLPSVIQSDIIQPAVNMNFYGAQLEKEPNPYDEYEPRWQRTFMRDQNTSIYRGLKWLEQNTRRTPSENSDPESPEMTKQQKGYVDISPAIAKHMVDNIFGGTGAWVMRLGDATRNGWEWLANGGESPIKESRGIPFVRTNYRSAQKDRGEGRQRARMYDLKKMMKNVEDNIKFYGKDMKVNPIHNLRYKELWDSEEGQLYREFYDDIKLIDKYEKKVKEAPEGEAKRNAQERLNEQRRVLLELIDAKQAQLQGDAIE